MLLVSIVMNRRNMDECTRRLRGNHVVALLCNLIETKTVSEKQVLDFALLFDLTNRRRLPSMPRFLEELQEELVKNYPRAHHLFDTAYSSLPSPIAHQVFGEEMGKVTEKIRLMLTEYGMEPFPHPLEDCEFKSGLQGQMMPEHDLVISFLRYCTEALKIKYLKEKYLDTFGLVPHRDRAQQALRAVWSLVRHDRHLLATYLKAREKWQDLRILTKDNDLLLVQEIAPDLFSIEMV